VHAYAQAVMGLVSDSELQVHVLAFTLEGGVDSQAGGNLVLEAELPDLQGLPSRDSDVLGSCLRSNLLFLWLRYLHLHLLRRVA